MSQNSRIIVKNLPKYLTESALKDHFSSLGRVTDCRIIFKGNTNRGFAFLGFRDPQSASDAVKNFNKTFIGSQKIIVQFALMKGNKNLKSRKSKNVKRGSDQKDKREVEGVRKAHTKQTDKEVDGETKRKDEDLLKNRFFVKNFPFSITEDELRELFEQFGELNECRIIRNSEQQSRGFGFVGFNDELEAAKAYASLHNTSRSFSFLIPKLNLDEFFGWHSQVNPHETSTKTRARLMPIKSKRKRVPLKKLRKQSYSRRFTTKPIGTRFSLIQTQF
jgi:RNA recognition motif-containing protein